MQRIFQLDGLRAILALWVVFVHCGKAVFPLNELPLGDVLFDDKTRVKIFFMISGMVIFGMFEAKRPAYADFLSDRLVRIYPVFFVALLISLAMMPLAVLALSAVPFPAEFNAVRLRQLDSARDALAPHLMAHLTMLHGVAPNFLLKDAPFTIIGQAWNISTEFQFYIMIPALAWLVHQQGKTRALGVALLLIFAIAGRSYPNEAFLGRYAEFFAVGALSYYGFKCAPSFVSNRPEIVPFAVGAVVAIAIVAGLHDWSISLWLSFLLAIAPHHVADSRFNPFAFLASPVMQLIGKFSYSIYLSHMAVLYLAIMLLSRISLDRMSYFLSLFLLTSIGATMLAWALYRFVEEPVRRSQLARRLAAISLMPLLWPVQACLRVASRRSMRLPGQ